MTARDILIARTFDAPTPATPGADHGPWRLSATGKTPRTFEGFRDAYDVALMWATETGGEIYRQTTEDGEPELYTPSG